MDERQVTTKQRMQETRTEGQAPLLKVHLFGPFQLHWQVPSCTQESAWDSRTSARSLFKLLLCAPDRQASKSLLAGILWPETDEEKALESLRSAVKVLRKVLCTATGEVLIEPHGSSAMLKLAEQRRLWVDTDAFEAYVAQASRTTTPDEALALWQQARMLLQGEFLAEDQQYEWIGSRPIKQRRQTLWMARSRMIRHLSDLYIQRGEIALAEEELEQHSVRFPTDQDALYRLLTLLEQQDCFEQATILYTRTKHILEASGKQPTKHVRAVYERIQQAVSSRPQVLPSRTDSISAETPSAMISMPHPALARGVTPTISHHGIKGSKPNLIGTMSLISSLSGTDSSSDTILNVLRLLSGFEGRQDMSLLSRRQLLELGIAAFISCLARLDSKHISAVEQEELGRALSQSIVDGWELVHTISSTEMLALSQMQLSLIHQAHAFLHPSTRPYLYAEAYALVGVSLHLQDRNEEALQAYHRAHMAAIAMGDPWHIAQCLLSQANVYLPLGRYTEAIPVIEEAYSYLGDTSEEHRRAKAHLLGVRADAAIIAKDFETARRKLDAATVFLDHISPNEEFDRSSWCILAGKYAYFTGDHAAAAQWYEQALREEQVQSLIRQTLALMPLISTYTVMQDLDASLITVERAAQVIPVLNAPMLNKSVIQALQGLPVVFPHETRIHEIVSNLSRQLHLDTSEKFATE